MNLVELEDLPCDAVAAHHDGVALGEGQVGHAAKAEADGAVDCGAGVFAQMRAMFPQFCGISGSTRTIFSTHITPVAVASDCFLKIRSSSIVRQTGGKINRKNC